MSTQKYKDGTIELLCDGIGESECKETTKIIDGDNVTDEGWMRVDGSTVSDFYCPKCMKDIKDDPLWPLWDYKFHSVPVTKKVEA